MARQTRQQRQARRQGNGGAAAETLPVAPERAPEAGGRGAAPPRAPRPPREGHPERHARRGNFLNESVGELKKVEWPTQAQVIQGTVVVLIACLVVGVFLYGADQAFKHLVNDVFLR